MRYLYSLEARERTPGAKWWLVDARALSREIHAIQKALRKNWREPHDFRIIRWGR